MCRTSRKQNFKPQLELLEDRWLLSHCPDPSPANLWSVHPATCEQYQELPEEKLYLHTRGGEDDGMIDLHVRLVRPAVPFGVKVPVILVYSAYSSVFTTWRDVGTLFGGNPNSTDAMPLKDFFVSRGYALALADVPGTGNSGGCWDMLGRREQAAGYDLVEWLGTQPWSNGKVGMIGGSYSGGTAIMTAAAHPPHLATIVAEFPLSSAYDVLYHDGVRMAAEGPYSGSLDIPVATVPPVFDFGFGAVTQSDQQHPGYASHLVERACPDTLDKLTHTQRGYDLDPTYDSFWQERDWVKDAANLAVPAPQTGQEISVLVSGGWTDELVRPPHQTRWFDAIPVDNPDTPSDEGVPFKMLVMGNRAHVFQSPEFRDVNLLHAWFDHFLYGHDTNIENQAPVWSKANDQAIRHELDWPSSRTASANLFLHAGGGLSVKPSRDSEFLGRYADTGTETDSQVFISHSASGANFLWFESSAFQQDVRIAGAPQLKLFASTSTTSTHFTPVLFDLGPHEKPFDPLNTQSGEMLFKLYGNQECEALQEQEVCVLSRGFLNARFKDGLEQGKDLVPDNPYKATVRFVDKDWILKAGHRIGLVVMSSNSDWAVPDQQRAINSLSSKRGTRSVLILPVVGGKTALEGALPSPDSSPGDLINAMSSPSSNEPSTSPATAEPISTEAPPSYLNQVSVDMVFAKVELDAILTLSDFEETATTDSQLEDFFLLHPLAL